ncbi:MAG: endonuclease/exonuclease/phosphatase family protein, partial [Chloroflexota bacterium]
EVGFRTAAEFAARLGDVYPHRALHPQPWANSGQGAFSKYPILEDEFWHLDDYIHLGHQRMVIDIDGTSVIVYNIHPLHPGMVNMDVSKRTEDVQTVIDRVAADPPDMPAIIAGDFNLTDLTADYRSFRRTGFRDVHRDVGRGFGFTFPATDPVQLLRLDYVFYNDYWTPLTSQVIRQAGQSDHYPLLVTLELNAP